MIANLSKEERHIVNPNKDIDPAPNADPDWTWTMATVINDTSSPCYVSNYGITGMTGPVYLFEGLKNLAAGSNIYDFAQQEFIDCQGCLMQNASANTSLTFLKNTGLHNESFDKWIGIPHDPPYNTSLCGGPYKISAFSKASNIGFSAIQTALASGPVLIQMNYYTSMASWTIGVNECSTVTNKKINFVIVGWNSTNASWKFRALGLSWGSGGYAWASNSTCGSAVSNSTVFTVTI